MLQLVSSLPFGTCDAALTCAAAIAAAKDTIRAAAEAGAPVTESDAVVLLEAAARADACLRLGKWYGHAFGDTVEGYIADGWSSAEVRGRKLLVCLFFFLFGGGWGGGARRGGPD